MNRVIAGRKFGPRHKFAHLIGALCAAALAGAWSMDILNSSMSTDHLAWLTAGGLLAVAGGIYAATKTNRWWYALAIAGALTLFVCVAGVAE